MEKTVKLRLYYNFEDQRIYDSENKLLFEMKGFDD